ncbi:nucleotidyltransferase [Candidatus Berkelbacteria bacterium]|nr:nucleotidyltransferase [Candidatus Berkelbacteria bacterium]
MKPTLLVLAAGVGSRYGGLKQLDLVGSLGTIIDYSVYDALEVGFGKIVFVINKLLQAEFETKIGRKYAKVCEIAYVRQELTSDLLVGFNLPSARSKPWGTGHAILVAEEAIQEPFVVVNADDFYGRESFRVIANFLRSSNEYGLVGFTLKNTLSKHGTVSRGICRLDKGSYLTNVTELTRIGIDDDQIYYLDAYDQRQALTGRETVSMGMWAFQPTIFKHLRQQFLEFLTARGQDLKAEFFIPTVVSRLIETQQARVRVLSSNSRWFGMTLKEDRENVRQTLNALKEQYEDFIPQSGAR